MTQSYTLVAIDVSGIQPYIFSSNNLKHNLGASEFVHQATHGWVREFLPKPHNMLPDERLEDKPIENGDVAAEVIYIGGGNALILFDSHEAAYTFAQKLSRKALLEAPGLKLTFVLKDFAWAESLGQIVKQTLQHDLYYKKQRGTLSAPLLGLGVTADCQFTGLPAIGYDDESRRISSEVEAKSGKSADANQRLRAMADWQDYKPMDDFNQLGSYGESSYLAVVHTDGNGMGKRFQAITEQDLPNREYIRQVRALSHTVQQAAEKALASTVQCLIDSINPDDQKIGGIVPVRDKFLPFRPIVFGGDDVTFVCDGRLGLTLAQHYIQAFESQPLSDGACATARAGIAVVKTHYPFARAYQLAEELAKEAKKRIQCIKKDEGKRVSAIDWHFGVSGLVLDLKELREREYKLDLKELREREYKEGSLLMRPLRLDDASSDWRNWTVFRQIIDGFEEQLQERRNKVKALRDALRNGPDAVERFVEMFGMPLPAIEKHNGAMRRGWIGKNCAYFDAVEALDFFVPLKLGGQA